MAQSSAVWWSSTARSPLLSSSRFQPAWNASAVSRWSRKPIPVATAARPVPSRSRTATFDVTLPSVLALAERTWSTIGIVSRPAGAGFDIDVYLDGYLLASFSPSDDYFRITPGRLALTALVLLIAISALVVTSLALFTDSATVLSTASPVSWP